MPADESRERDAAAEPLIRASVQQTRNQAGKAIFARAIDAALIRFCSRQ
jgi:hypothetical protein